MIRRFFDSAWCYCSDVTLHDLGMETVNGRSERTSTETHRRRVTSHLRYFIRDKEGCVRATPNKRIVFHPMRPATNGKPSTRWPEPVRVMGSGGLQVKVRLGHGPMVVYSGYRSIAFFSYGLPEVELKKTHKGASKKAGWLALAIPSSHSLVWPRASHADHPHDPSSNSRSVTQ